MSCLLPSLTGDTVNLNAGDAYTQSASNVMAANDVTIKAKTIDITTADNTGISSTEDKALKIGAFARVSSPIIDLANSIDTASKSDGRLQAMQEMAVAANAYTAAKAVKDTAERFLNSTADQALNDTVGGEQKGSLVSVETGVGFTTNKSSENSNYSTAQASTITGGNNVNLTTTEGDIHASGATLTAGKTLSLDSAKDILLDAGVNSDHSDGKRSGYGVEVGVGASVGAKIGVYAYVGVQASRGKSNSDSTAYDNTHLTADTINLKANDNLTLSGADARANTINADAGENLTIQSLQDQEKSTANESGMNLKVQVSIGTAWKASGSANAAQAKGNYQSVNQQSGLFAEDGGYNINVGKNTNLIGGVISSSDKAIAEYKNSLTTGTLTMSDLENHSSYSAEAVAVSGGSDFTKANINGVGAGVEAKSESSLTRSAISQGAITITDGTKQQELTGKTAQETVEGINTDTAHAHTALDKLPDLKEVLANQKAMATATLTVVQTGVQVAQDIKDGKNVLGDATKVVAGNTLNAVAFAGNIITGNMDVDNAIASFQDPYKMSEALKSNPELAASLDAFTKGQFDNLPKTKEGLQALADATGLNVNVLLTTVTNYQDTKGTTDGKLIALDVNPENRADTLSTLGHEESHARGGTSETLADMSGYATQLLSEVAIGSYEQSYLNAMQFEMGTGKDEAIQLLNQALLINDNLKLIQALDDHPAEFDYSKSQNLPKQNTFVTVPNTTSYTKDAVVGTLLIDFSPLGVVKDFSEAKSLGDYFWASLGIVPGERVLSGAFKAYQDAKALGDVEGMVKAVNDAKNQVGEYNTLVKTSIKNDGLDNHHVPQKNLAQQNGTFNYPQDANAKTAPAIRIDEITHKEITKYQKINEVARRQMTPRELLADDVRILRDVGIPNDKIQQLVQMNKDKYGLTK